MTLFVEFATDRSSWPWLPDVWPLDAHTFVEEDDWFDELDIGGEPVDEMEDWDTAPFFPRRRGTAGEWPDDHYTLLEAVARDACEARGLL